jgi:hypothetical protein
MLLTQSLVLSNLARERKRFGDGNVKHYSPRIGNRPRSDGDDNGGGTWAYAPAKVKIKSVA